MKRSIISCFILAVYFLLLETNSSAQWEQLPGPNGGYVSHVGFFGEQMIACGTDNGMFRSSDGGDKWNRVPNSPAYTVGFASIGATIYSAVGSTIYYSPDTGMTWFNMQFPIAGYSGISSIASLDSFLYVTTDSGLYSSPDGGVVWEDLTAGISDTLYAQVISSGEFLYCNTYKNVFRSADYGLTWMALSMNLDPDDWIAKIIAADSVIVASIYGKLLYSKDYGLNWQEATGDIPTNCSLQAITFAGDKFYVSCNQELFVSEVPSFSFTQTSSEFPLATSVSNLYAKSDTLYFSTTNKVKGLWRSVNSGNTWQLIGLPVLTALDIGISSTGILVSTVDDPMYSTDQGETWVSRPNISCYVNSSDLVMDEDYAYSFFLYGLGIYRLDYQYEEALWQHADDVVETYVQCLYTDGSLLFAGGYDAIWRTSDNGWHWEKLTSGLPDPALVLSLTRKDNYLFAGTADDGLFRSDDNGDHWTLISTNLPPIPIISDLEVCGNLLLAKCADGIWASADNGISFWNISSSLPYQGTYANAIEAIGPDIFVGISNYGVYWTQNNGNSWLLISDNLPAQYGVYRLAHDDDYLYVSGSGSMWRRPLSDFPIGIALDDQYKETDVTIFPNPASDFFTVEISLPQVRSVRLTIRDVFGRETFTYEIESGKPTIIPVPESAYGQVFLCRLWNDGTLLAVKKVLIQ